MKKLSMYVASMFLLVALAFGTVVSPALADTVPTCVLGATTECVANLDVNDELPVIVVEPVSRDICVTYENDGLCYMVMGGRMGMFLLPDEIVTPGSSINVVYPSPYPEPGVIVNKGEIPNGCPLDVALDKVIKTTVKQCF